MKKKSTSHCLAVESGSIDLLLSSFSGRAVGRHVLRGWLTDHRRLLDITLNPQGYGDDVEGFRCDYQAISLLKKYPSLNLPVNRAEEALKGFLKSEVHCGGINVRFCNLLRTSTPEVYELLVRARSVVSGILGPFDWDAAIRHCDFGPGASVGVPRSIAHEGYKIGMKNPTVTGQCSTLLTAYQAWDTHLGDTVSDFEIVDGSRVTTVPKDARKDRIIAIEPLWNMFFQKGIGGLVRARLRRIGLDLDKQQPINQALAHEGSLTGRLATLDLSAASDSISLELARWLIPSDWFDAMVTTRSSYAELPSGQKVFLRKLSSMGNGFTFEVETLIFLALCLACCPNSRVNRDVACFGDDIIIPSQHAEVAIGLLKFCGFTTNVEKSFVSGPFRESCGKHFFSGHDVTPLYLRKEVKSTLEVITLANQLTRLASRWTGGQYRSARFQECRRVLLRHIPGRFRKPTIPDGYGDSGLIGDLDECCPKRHKFYDAWVVPVLSSTRPVLREIEGPPALVMFLWRSRRQSERLVVSEPCCSSQGSVRENPWFVNQPTGREVLGPERVRPRFQLVPQWSHLGPWA